MERGYQEGYDLEQALRWCWQIARGLWTLQAADIGFRALSLRHVLLTAPDGDVRLSGFDALVGEQQQQQQRRDSSSSSISEEEAGEGEAEEEGGDSRKGLWDLGRVLHMTLTCSTDREDDTSYYQLGRRDAGRAAAPTLPSTAAAAAAEAAAAAAAAPAASAFSTLAGAAAARRRAGVGMAAGGAARGNGKGSNGSSGSGGSLRVAAAPRPFLAAIPTSARPVVLGLLATTPSYAMPLGLALEALAELVGVDAPADAALEARRRTLRPVEEKWWGLVQEQEDAEDDYGGSGAAVVERKASGGAGPREARLALAEACLALGEEWERHGKAYRAIELYVDAVAFAGEAAAPGLGPQGNRAGEVETEAWGRIADIRQGQGQHAAALRVLKGLVARYEAEARSCRALYEREEAQAPTPTSPQGEPEAKAAGNGSSRRRRRERGASQQQQGQALPDPAAGRGTVAGQQWVEAAERLAGARVRLAASLRELKDAKQALAHLNTAQRELEQAGAAVVSVAPVEGAVNVSSGAMARVLTGKAAVYRQRQSFIQALEMYESVLELRRRAVAREDPELAGLLVGMAEIYAEKGDGNVALDMLIQAYKRMAEAAAPQQQQQQQQRQQQVPAVGSGVGGEADRLLMASTLERIGRLFAQRGQLEDALMCYRAAHDRQSQQLARAHPAVGETLSAMADLYERKGDYRAAGQMHGRALEIRRAVLSPTSPALAASLYGLGNAHQRLKSPRAALQAYEEAEAIRRVGGSSGEGAGSSGGLTPAGAAVALGDVLVNMSRPLKALRRDAEAVARLREAREVYTQQAGLGSDDPRVCTVTDNLRVLGALAAAAAAASSKAAGAESANGNGQGGDRRERLLQHHARATTSSSSVSANTQGKQAGAGAGQRAAPAGAGAHSRGSKNSNGCVVS